MAGGQRHRHGATRTRHHLQRRFELPGCGPRRGRRLGTRQEPSILAVVDNDLILKSVSYGLVAAFWPDAGSDPIGVLGAARYVIAGRLDRKRPNRGARAAKEDLSELLARCEELEPNEEEIELATEIEVFGQEHGLALDNGESQLAAIVVGRGIPLLETGDKRAIAGLETARSHLVALEGLSGRVRCLEQIALRQVRSRSDFEEFSAAICAEKSVDRSLSICLGCLGGTPADQETTLEALDQYVREVRRSAPTLLAAD